MRWLFLMLLATASCGTHPSVANDDDPRYCSHQYPIEEPPEFCESFSWGDCCIWEGVETDDGVCRYDYCSTYEDRSCTWSLQYKSCEEG
jgi:hypothetical protein